MSPSRTQRPADGPGEDPPPRILERPDGYYWIATDGIAEVGPFDTYELAEADRDSAGSDGPEPGEDLSEAEGELGMNDWLDRETGEPAEGQSPPRLADE